MEKLLKGFGLGDIPNSWQRNWDYANDTLPSEGISFLTPEHIEKARRHIRLSESNVKEINNAIFIIRENNKLRFLAWLWHCILFKKQDYDDEDISSWPLLPQSLGMPAEKSSLIPAIVILSGYDHAISVYKKIGPIPQDVIGDTLSSVEICMNIHREENRSAGLSLTHMRRLLYHLNGKMFNIGRLEFHMQTFGRHLRAYRNESSGKVITLAEDGMWYRSDGHVDGTNEIFDEKAAWSAKLLETSSKIEGHTISDTGYASKNKISFDNYGWSIVLTEGDDVLNVHIPRGVKLTPESVQDSFEQASNFFDTYFPDIHFRAFVCISWMLDPQLQELLDQSSNLVRFQEEFNLFPVLSNDQSLYKFVFPCEPSIGVHDLPENTSLQKKIKKYMIDGGRLHTGGGFILNKGENKK